jgi:hypothetical protein
MSSWNGLMKILWIEQIRNNEVIWRAENIKNVLHTDGESYILRAAFTGGPVSEVIPENYYIGLDARFSLAASDTITDLLGEPTINGYTRQAVSSTGNFTVTIPEGSANYRATSPIVAFQAEGGSWGPVKNVFLTDTATSSGNLICSAELPSQISVVDGDTITMRLGLSLKDC